MTLPMAAPLLALVLALPRIGIAPLLFEAYPDGKGGQILFIRDCGRGGIPADSTCESWQAHFAAAGTVTARDGRTIKYPGDSEVLRSILAQRAFTEVWLFSGGGALSEGVGLGRLFRRNKMTVRVPNVARVRTVLDWPEPRQEVHCVSSCTVAFMGGLFRYLDPGATYEVHSASTVMNQVSARYRELISQGKVGDIAAEKYVTARYTVIQLLTHFQNTLLQMAGRPGRSEDDAEFERWATRPPRQAPYPAERAAQDQQRLVSEGYAAAQDLIMRMERDAMAWAIEDVKGILPQLGGRAQPALRMVETMYDVSIMDTQSLSRETMLRMGYLTQELEPRPEE